MPIDSPGSLTERDKRASVIVARASMKENRRRGRVAVFEGTFNDKKGCLTTNGRTDGRADGSVVICILFYVTLITAVESSRVSFRNPFRASVPTKPAQISS